MGAEGYTWEVLDCAPHEVADILARQEKGREAEAIVARNQYPTDWPEIALRVKEEASWRCVRCGHAHSVEGWYVLTVHHLDGDKANCRWWNLPALCQRCHLAIQGRVKMEQSYLHPHSDWFRPYVAGYYAFTILGVDLSRAEVMERLDELLLVGQPWLEGVRP